MYVHTVTSHCVSCKHVTGKFSNCETVCVGPFCGFVNGDDPHRLLEEAPLSQRRHSTPELDEADAKLPRLRWGDLEPVPTPAHGRAA